MSTNVPWWSKRKGKGKGKEKSSEPAPALAAAKSSTEAPPPKAPEVPKAPTPKAPATPKVAAPKPDSKQKESERKRKLAEASQVANGSDEYSAAFRPPPGKFVIVTDTSMAAQAICDRLEGGLKCQRSEKVEVIPLISGFADICTYHAERALAMFDSEVVRGIRNPQVQTQDSGFVAKYRTRRPQLGYSSPNVGWLTKSLGSMTLPNMSTH